MNGLLSRAAFVSVLGLALVPQAGAENSWTDSRVTRLVAHDDGSANTSGLIAVYMPSAMAWVPACHVGATNKFFVDLSRNPSKAQYAMLLAAATSQQTVTIALNNSCISGVALLRNVEMSG